MCWERGREEFSEEEMRSGRVGSLSQVHAGNSVVYVRFGGASLVRRSSRKLKIKSPNQKSLLAKR